MAAAASEQDHKKIIWIPARSLNIFEGDDPNHWKWKIVKDGDESFEVAELITTRRLDVSGRFKISQLTPDINYEFVYIVMLREDAKGWEKHITLQLSLPTGQNLQKLDDSLPSKPKEQWTDVKVDKFLMEEGETGYASFQLFEYGEQEKGGLIIKGVSLREVASAAKP